MNVVCVGVFDIIHPGHINLIIYGRRLANTGRLYVLIDDDELVMATKGLQRPIFSVHERAAALMALKSGSASLVDEVDIFQTNQVLENMIRRIKPDVLLKGSDWRGKKITGEEYAGMVMFFERLEEYSTSEIIRRVLEKHTVLR